MNLLVSPDRFNGRIAEMVNMEEAINATLHRMETTAFAWGTNDCDVILADYVRMVTGRDPMAEWRGRYFSEAEAARFFEPAGGNAALVERGMRSIGIEPKSGEEARRGDVISIEFAGGRSRDSFSIHLARSRASAAAGEQKHQSSRLGHAFEAIRCDTRILYRNDAGRCAR